MELKLERERVKLLEDFINSASHDLKTPITNLKSRVYLLSKARDDATRERQIGVIETEVLRLERLIEDLLTMATLDSLSAKLTFENVDINVLLHDACRVANALGSAKNLTVMAHTDSRLPRIQGEPVEINRVLMNLLNNAINYTDQGQIDIIAAESDGGILIEIKDTGTGIPEEEIPYIFDRFYRADKARNQDRGGTGLGLAIVRRIIELHHGWITVESELNKGTAFHVWLPIEQPSPSKHV